MGERGPPKKPTELKLLQGVPGGTHKLNPDEPKPEKVVDATPSFHLNEVALAKWKEMSEKLERLGLLTEIDLDALSRYCDIYEKWLVAKEFLDKNGFYYPIYKDQTAEQVKNKVKKELRYMGQFPQVSIYQQLTRELARLAQQFGMTPASRAGVGIDATKNPKSQNRRRLYGT